MMKELENRLFDRTWNNKNRGSVLEKLKTTKYDLIIIGGGITGAGVAREAAIRDLRVALIDMQDFAAGTSSRSSKLAHGGIRYLSHGDTDLVKESATERNWMRAHIPHLIRPIPFLFAALEGKKYKKRDIIGACKIYDFLSDKDQDYKNYKKHQWYSPEEAIELEPEFIKEGNLGAAVYYDNNVDDARLTIETLKEAIIRGADIVNYCKVVDYILVDGKIIGVKCKDLEDDYEFQIKGTLVVNATGIWTDKLLKNYPNDIPKPLIRPTKGVHLIYRREHVKNRMATILHSIDDNRVFFVLPRDKDFTVIGTTDTYYTEDLKNPFINKDDADYLIRSVKHYFPNAEIDHENIVSTYAGIRPLVMQKGKSESDISRKHTIFFSDDGLLTITGGKLTAWRNMAEDLLTEIEKKKLFEGINREKHFSKQKFIIGLAKDEWVENLKKSGVSLAEDISDHLYQQYGKGAIKIIDLIKEDGSLKERIIEKNDFIKAEIIYCLRYEMTPHLIDVFCRRTEMALWIHHKQQFEATKKIADIMASEYSWNDQKKAQEIDLYMGYIEKTVAFLK
jgi:glycerol-3-phosphate dehydrogenase